MLSTIVDDKTIERLVCAANHFLERLSSKPKIDTSPIEHQIKKVRAQRDRLFRLVEDGKESSFESARERIRRRDRHLAELHSGLQEAKRDNQIPPPPLTRLEVESYLPQIRELLRGDVVAASRTLEQLTGPVMIHEAKRVGGDGWDWSAKFSLNLVPALVRLERQNADQSRGVWEFLSTRGLIATTDVEFDIVDPPKKFERLAPRVRELLAQEPEPTILAISGAIGVNHGYATKLVRYVKFGERPTWPKKKNRKNRGKGGGRVDRHIELAPIAAEMRDILRNELPRDGSRAQWWPGLSSPGLRSCPSRTC